MIGILCNEKSEKFIVQRLHELFRPLMKGEDMPIVVFTLQGVNLQQKMITGWIISSERPCAIRAKLPDIIFNLAVQYSRSEIKNIRGLMEIEDVSLMNITNRYNQWSIMKMLSSDNTVKKYVLPYADLSDTNYRKGISDTENFIFKPLKGASSEKIVYGKQSDSGFGQYGMNTKNLNDRHDIGKTKKLLLLKTPELLTKNRQLCISRLFVQKILNNDWEVISRLSVPQNECAGDSTDNMMNKASIQIINSINRFIPDIFFGFVDFVIDMKGIPYFLNFGGWDKKILSRPQNMDIQVKICKNMLEYAQAFLNKQIEGEDDVD